RNVGTSNPKTRLAVTCNRETRIVSVPVPGFGMVGLGKVNKSRPHQRRRRIRQPATAKRGRFKPMMHHDRLRGHLRKKLCWLNVGVPSENSQHGNARKKDGFWCEVLAYIESKTKIKGRRTYDMVMGKWKTVRPAVVWFCGVYGNVMSMTQESGAGDEDYVQKAMIHYQAETGLPIKFRHCWMF
nr:hypothetical protein [Tanacetum cinerariifolium]